MSTLGLLALVLLIGIPASALAADFTFQVPVTLTNVPSVTSIYVDCSVSRVEVDGVSPLGGANVVGIGTANVPVSGGSYSGAVTVEVNASGIITPDQARSYFCGMRAIGRSRTGATYAASSGNMQTVYETATGTTLTSFRSNISGRIPR